ncbi:MAG TPA: cyclin-dependent kinase inhibitor 3 family protein [Polyangiaceae bacterium]|nr:cyclin-dependent kinase inhibitor 3 family protein [Polyangiaceae bacterium]
MASEVKTSTSHPIRVDFLPAEAVGLPGKIGLTFAPGKKAQGIAGDWDRDLTQDLQRLRTVYSVSMLVSLVEDHELASLQISELVKAAGAVELSVLRFPFADAGIPSAVEPLVALVDQILETTAAGQNVVIHCRGGLGRTGLVAACCLIARGHEPTDAMRITRAARKAAIETRGQEAFVRGFKRR